MLVVSGASRFLGGTRVCGVKREATGAPKPGPIPQKKTCGFNRKPTRTPIPHWGGPIHQKKKPHPSWGGTSKPSQSKPQPPLLRRLLLHGVPAELGGMQLRRGENRRRRANQDIKVCLVLGIGPPPNKNGGCPFSVAEKKKMGASCKSRNERPNLFQKEQESTVSWMLAFVFRIPLSYRPKEPPVVAVHTSFSPEHQAHGSPKGL